MLHTIICSSKTGNTAKLAQRAREVLDARGGRDAGSAAGADLVLLGSWTDKGGLDPALGDVLPQLAGKRVFLFVTCGFGGDPAYCDRVLDNFAAALPAGARVVGRFMCQGQMPPAVRTRYEGMAERDPARFLPMIENFDRALGHPRAPGRPSSTTCAAARTCPTSTTPSAAAWLPCARCPPTSRSARCAWGSPASSSP